MSKGLNKMTNPVIILNKLVEFSFQQKLIFWNKKLIFWNKKTYILEKKTYILE
jgi:hypothetical protein